MSIRLVLDGEISLKLNEASGKLYYLSAGRSLMPALCWETQSVHSLLHWLTFPPATFVQVMLQKVPTFIVIR